MAKYTILSFNFNGYDKLREPLFVDPDAEYIYITDHPVKSTYWKVIVDIKLVNKNPIYSAYYVRYHPFQYVTTDIVFVMDSSIQIKDSLHIIYAEFEKSNAVYAPMGTNYKTDEDKINKWVNATKRMSNEDGNKALNYIRNKGQENYKGSIGMAFAIYRKDKHVLDYLNHVWKELFVLSETEIPFRLDEIVAHKIMAEYADKLVMLPLSSQVIQSGYMTYCEHNSDRPIVMRPNYDQYFYLCNHPVSPIRFDKAINYPKSYRFKTEAILLTKYLDALDMVEWINHHLNVVKFDHIHVFDNTSNSDIKGVCDSYNEVYGDKISYQKVYGHPRQYRLYDAYINNISDAEWVMPIDDDEYLDIGDFDSVYDAIKYYDNKLPHMMVLGVRWKHLFPKKFHSERKEGVLDYCTEENPELAKSFMHLGDTTIKCIVKRYGNIHYEETWENPAGGHVPKHTSFYGAVMCDGRAVLGCGIPDCPDNLEDERIRLIHCRYKGYSDWMSKYHNDDPAKKFLTVSDVNVHERKYKFDELLPTLD